LRLLDEPATQAIDEVVRLAAEVCGVPSAMLTMTDDKRTHMFGPFVGGATPLLREQAICDGVVRTGIEFIRSDVRLEPDLADNPLVDGTVAGVRFYAAVPLVTQSGEVFGALCAFDEEVHHLTEIQGKMLRALAAQVTAVFELRRATADVEQATHRLALEEEQAAEVLETSSDAYLAWEPDGTVFAWNTAAENLYGYPAYEAIGQDLAELIVVEEDRERFRRALEAGTGGAAQHRKTLRVGQRRRDGTVRTVDLVIWPSYTKPGWHAFARDVTDIVRAEQERIAAEERWRVAFENAPVGMLVSDVTDPERPVISSANRQYCAMLGRTEAELRDLGVAGVTHPDDLARDIAGGQALMTGVTSTYRAEKRYVHADGSEVWGRLTATLAHGADRKRYVISQVEDITPTRAAERARQQAEALLATAFEHAPNGTAIIGVRGDQRRLLLRVNPALSAMTGRSDLLLTDLAALLDDGAEEVLADFERLAEGEIEHVERVCRLRAGGGHIVAQAFVALTRDADGRPDHALAQLRDITQQQAHEDWLTQRAKTDTLTGLANRLAMRERLVEEIGALRAGTGALAVLLIDLDRFKEVNDTLGHQVGDDLLCGVADALVEALPADALACRLGGDEFLILAPHQDDAGAARLAERMTAAVTEAAAQLGDRLDRPVTGSVGLSLTANPSTAPNELIQAADQAMYEVKRNKQGHATRA
jgi:diguanylate cyclase (GGDEF)-like protein/PAS domain S-box-containing protein